MHDASPRRQHRLLRREHQLEEQSWSNCDKTQYTRPKHSSALGQEFRRLRLRHELEKVLQIVGRQSNRIVPANGLDNAFHDQEVRTNSQLCGWQLQGKPLLSESLRPDDHSRKPLWRAVTTASGSVHQVFNPIFSATTFAAL